MLFSADFIPPYGLPQLQTGKALLIVDLQKDFSTPEGKLPVENVRSFVEKVPKLATKFRSHGQVVWVRTEFLKPKPTISKELGGYSVVLKEFLQAEDEDEPQPQHLVNTIAGADVAQDPEAFLADCIDAADRCCVPGTPGSQYHPIIQGAIDTKSDLDLVKACYSAFEDPSLLMHLRQSMITKLYVCGALSNISVFATVLDAVRHGLTVTIVEDCVGYRDDVCHIEAMKQMADAMGAEGIDYQELMDDLSGLLGDVIREEDFPNRFEVSVSSNGAASRSTTGTPQPHESCFLHTRRSAAPGSPSPKTSLSSIVAAEDLHGESLDLVSKLDTSSKRSSSYRSSTASPPRKRSVSDADESTETKHIKSRAKTARRASDEAPSQRKQNKMKPRVRRPNPDRDGGTGSTLSHEYMGHSKSEGDLAAEVDNNLPQNPTGSLIPDTTQADGGMISPKKSKSKGTKEYLGPDDIIGDGDSRLVLQTIPSREAIAAFNTLKQHVKWHKMLHRTGEVPRLVAVQGAVQNADKVVPIYRHPADEAPELLPFDDTVSRLKQMVEKNIGHTFNHVLIQYYRNGEDNISEHSDKTLDIVRGSNIVNLSLGATRTMTLRTKRCVHSASENRTVQHIHLPNTSLFVLGQKTNQNWLHSVRPDRRIPSEKSAGELDFGQERISLTFRHVGTFLDTEHNKIWGQGATAKNEKEANQVLTGPNAKDVCEKMLNAFGMENHQSSNFDWEEVYGSGFDVVNFEVNKG